MEIELLEIQDFISQYNPFTDLPEEELSYIAKNIEISYYRMGSMINTVEDPSKELYMIRSGVVEIHRRKGELYNRLDQGKLFGQVGLLTNNKVRFLAKSVKDTLLYCIPEAIFHDLYDRYESFADFVEVEDSMRLKQAVESKSDDANALMSSKVKTLLTREALMLPNTSSMQSVAQFMSQENVSAVLINDPSVDDNNFVGIITEHDLCVKVIAGGLDVNDPVDTIMSTKLISLDHNAYILKRCY